MNGTLIYENIKTFRNIDELFKQNITKFSNSKCTPNVINNIEKPLKQIDKNKVTIDINTPKTDSSEALYECKKQIDHYLDRCNNEQIPLAIHKANIRILNAIGNSYKKGYSKLTYQIIKRQLEEKISLAKRDFVKRECLLAIDILKLLKTSSADTVLKYLQLKYPN